MSQLHHFLSQSDLTTAVHALATELEEKVEAATILSPQWLTWKDCHRKKEDPFFVSSPTDACPEAAGTEIFCCTVLKTGWWGVEVRR